MQAGATVSALWRSNDTHLDLFATGTDGAGADWSLNHHAEESLQPGGLESRLQHAHDGRS
jgi:hypothetical protein